MDLSGALAVVTGATAGIGRAIAFALGRAGAKLAICSRTDQNVRATIAALFATRIDARRARLLQGVDAGGPQARHPRDRRVSRLGRYGVGEWAGPPPPQA